MDDQLTKIDVIRERLGVSYKEAKEALEKADGDLVQALISLEEKSSQGFTGYLKDKGEVLAGQVKDYIEKGNKTKVKLKREEKILFEVPATVGALGIVAALASTPVAIVAGVGAIAAVANKVSLEIEKPGGETKVVSLDHHRSSKDHES